MMTANSDIIRLYLQRLHECGVKIPSQHETWYGTVNLSCVQIRLDRIPTGFTCATSKAAEQPVTELDWQYNLRQSHNGLRPKAYRVPFADHAEFANSKEYTVSHLCHNNWCHNPRHHVLETLPDNKGRNGCPGGPNCRHRVRCLLPGPYFAGVSSYAPSAIVEQLFSV